MRAGQQYEEPDESAPLPDAATWQEGDDKIERPLSAFSDDELFDEMRLRYTAFFFGGQCYRHDDATRFHTRYKGRFTELIGLVMQCLWDLQSQAGFR